MAMPQKFNGLKIFDAPINPITKVRVFNSIIGVVRTLLNEHILAVVK
jgi:hypothetical protein